MWTFYSDFLCVHVSGEPLPRSLEGLFVYEERSTSPPANDTIVVEQWTVIEVSRNLVCVREKEREPECLLMIMHGLILTKAT